MRDLIDKRNKLNKNFQNLRTIKFIVQLKRENITKLIEEQDKVYKEFLFYREYIKAINKEKRR